MKANWIIPGLSVLCSLGCWGGNTGSVEGTVRVDGEPLGGFYVYFSPADGTAEAVGGVTADGKYTLTYGRGKTEIPIGEYRVYVEPTEFIDNVPRPKVKLAPQFTSVTEASLVKEITSGHNVIDLEIASRKSR